MHVRSAINQSGWQAHVLSIQTRIIAPTGEVVARNETPNRKIEPGESVELRT